MAEFKYKAVTASGVTEEATIEAADRFEVYTLMRKQGATVLSVAEAGSGSFNINKLLSTFSRVKEAEKIILIRNLSAMITAGLPLSRALSVMGRQSKNPKLKKILAEVETVIQKGDELSSAFRQYPDVFSPLVVAMVKAGEESGTLAQTLKTIAEQMDQSHQLKKKIHGALIFRSIVVFALIVVGILMLVYIVPTLTSTFTELGVELPMTTQMIISASQFLTNYTLIAFGLIATVIAGFAALLRTEGGKRTFDFALLRLPVIGTLVKETNAARTGRTLSSLLASGVNVTQAISITTEVLQHSGYRTVLNEAKEAVQRGESISSVVGRHEGLYPPLVSELISVGEETGKLSEMLKEVAIFYENEVEQKTKNMSTIIEPILMLLVGGVVGFFAVSMITPIYSITSNI